MRIKIQPHELGVFSGLKGIIAGYSRSDSDSRKQAYAESFTKDGHEYIKLFIAERGDS